MSFSKKNDASGRRTRQLIKLINAQEAQTSAALQPITPEQAEIAATKLKQLICNAPDELKKRYLRALIANIIVGKSEIIISGSKDALAEAASGEPISQLTAANGQVRSLVREWRTGDTP